jgi:ribonucleotide reductase alpha subunit
MRQPLEVQDAFNIVLDEIDRFMEDVYAEGVEIERVVKKAIEEHGPEELRDFISPLNVVLEKLDNMKIVLKTVAFQNYKLDLFTPDEQKNIAEVKSLLNGDFFEGL